MRELRGKSRAAGREQGFTLLEILVAIFIFAVVMTTIYSSFSAVISKNKAISRGRGIYETARGCLDRMASDLSSIYVEQPPLYEPPDFDDPPDPYRFEGSEEVVGSERFSRLRFAADAHLPMTGGKQGGIAGIVYYVDRAEGRVTEDRYVLRRADRAFAYEQEEDAFREEESDPVICEGIKEFKTVFYDAEGREYTEWNSDDGTLRYATPRAVAVKIKATDGETTKLFKTAVTLPVYREKIEEGEKNP